MKVVLALAFTLVLVIAACEAGGGMFGFEDFAKMPGEMGKSMAKAGSGAAGQASKKAPASGGGGKKKGAAAGKKEKDKEGGGGFPGMPGGMPGIPEMPGGMPGIPGMSGGMPGIPGMPFPMPGGGDKEDSPADAPAADEKEKSAPAEE